MRPMFEACLDDELPRVVVLLRSSLTNSLGWKLTTLRVRAGFRPQSPLEGSSFSHSAPTLALAGLATGDAGDDGMEYADDTTNDGLENRADGVNDGHDGASNGVDALSQL